MKYTLFINTAVQGQINLALFSDAKKEVERSIEVDLNYSEKLLPEIDALLTEAQLTLKDLSSIVVVHGPGRFSALRTGITTANTLAWSLNIPVIGIDLESSDEESVIKHISSVTEQHFTKPVIPHYGQEPNISIPKK